MPYGMDCGSDDQYWPDCGCATYELWDTKSHANQNDCKPGNQEKKKKLSLDFTFEIFKLKKLYTD
jgi:hypothetical protein